MSNMWNSTMFGDSTDLLNALHGFISISWASCQNGGSPASWILEIC